MYKTAVLVYKCLDGLASSYLAALCVRASRLGRSRLRSVVIRHLAVPCIKTIYGNQSIAVYSPVVGNSLLAELHLQDVIGCL